MEIDADADMTMDTNMLTLIVTGMTVDADTTTDMNMMLMDIVTGMTVDADTTTDTNILMNMITEMDAVVDMTTEQLQKIKMKKL